MTDLTRAIAVARALADDWNPDRDPILTAMFRDYAATILTSTDPAVHAALLAALGLESRGKQRSWYDGRMRVRRVYVTRWEDVDAD